MISSNHGVEGKKYLEKGLQFVSKGDIDNAVEAFFYAAAAFDRAQESKQAAALWEAIGNMLEPDFREKRKEYLEALKDGKVKEAYSKWYQFPLVYRVHAASEHVWKEHKNPLHRQAWAYQWAAEHMEQWSEHGAAYMLFLKAAQKAEQTKDGMKYPEWPGRLWFRAVVNHICSNGTADNEEVREVIEKMERDYSKIEDKKKRYSVLANSYRTLRSRLTEAANLTEADKFRRKERSALTRYYFHSKRLLHAVAEWLSGTGFTYFITALFVMVTFVFPAIYYHWDLITSAQGDIVYADAVLYSIRSSLSIGQDRLHLVGSGELLDVIERSLSWLGLGVFLWWLTKRLE